MYYVWGSKKRNVLRKSSKFGKMIIAQVNIIHSSKNMSTIRLGSEDIRRLIIFTLFLPQIVLNVVPNKKWLRFPSMEIRSQLKVKKENILKEFEPI